ncbi:DUF2993 domain-containing protein [Nodosilinea sp. E11]|uniref:LmeA family phospholipid-binding protein n=1 Tax=Nodosilinea sp. E11 TaxID=3037479 RepID=UPI002934D7F6|nr:DUF2993 domain-containing protein [Nodosilinea sp. E11]WOD40920.1 DUF2993 domain-containing protein [Nodosilinea sp. E11]
MAKGDADLGEQALSKAVEVGLTTQLDAVDSLKADIRTNPIALMQGELESASIQGQGLVIKDDLRTEQLSLKTDGLAIDPLKAALGEIQLTRPTNATAAIKLTEADIERACNSAYIQQKLEALKITLDDRPVRVQVQQVSVSLPGEGKVAIAAQVTMVDSGETQQVAFSAVPEMAAQGHQILLKQVQMAEANTSESLTNSLLEAARELLDLRQFTLSGMTLQIQHIDVQPGHMDLQAQAELEKFPGS